ncbi:lamin tail domain-containing protein [Corynebacterium aquatimens]|uniref:lamin tail domain-containing protein n=1 Tax=Corynebacterium aquatimens TaxID=1190508 RepID=UPI00254222F8|nr:lamin tail domain-containing protein [Corynebacterium aquatimens]QYH19596.1 lamin tail domain-containing protein [Corynebacterium aquatimens]
MALAVNVMAAPAIGAPASPIKINEVVTNGDEVSDWVELVNTSGVDVDISGWTAIDDGKKSVAITFPTDTSVPAGGFYRFYTENATPDGSKGFGLGGADSMTIRNTAGEEIDSFKWSKHPRILDDVNTSWSRIPDGAEDQWRECPIVCVRGLGLHVVRESVGVCHG